MKSRNQHAMLALVAGLLLLLAGISALAHHRDSNSPHGASIAGVVVDAEGHPVADAHVRVDGESSSRDPIQPRRGTRSGLDGRFVVSDLGPGTVFVHADCDGRGSSAGVRLELQDGDHRDDVFVQLLEGGTVIRAAVHQRRPTRRPPRDRLSVERRGPDRRHD